MYSREKIEELKALIQNNIKLNSYDFSDFDIIDVAYNLERRLEIFFDDYFDEEVVCEKLIMPIPVRIKQILDDNDYSTNNAKYLNEFQNIIDSPTIMAPADYRKPHHYEPHWSLTHLLSDSERDESIDEYSVRPLSFKDVYRENHKIKSSIKNKGLNPEEIELFNLCKNTEKMMLDSHESHAELDNDKLISHFEDIDRLTELDTVNYFTNPLYKTSTLDHVSLSINLNKSHKQLMTDFAKTLASLRKIQLYEPVESIIINNSEIQLNDDFDSTRNSIHTIFQELESKSIKLNKSENETEDEYIKVMASLRKFVQFRAYELLDFNKPHEKLTADFAKQLALLRDTPKFIASESFPKQFQINLLNKFKSHRILEYFDILYWTAINNIKITHEDFAEILFSDVDNFDTKAKISQSTVKYINKYFNFSYIGTLKTKYKQDTY